MRPRLVPQLQLSRCPHCGVDRPNIFSFSGGETHDYLGQNRRIWGIYQCGRCGGVIVAAAVEPQGEITEMYPSPAEVSEDIPATAGAYLEQAMHSLHAPAGAVMLAASAIDAMLKAKGLTEGSLNTRINAAAAQHIITSDMAEWAHEIRLDANDQRHADVNAIPGAADARKAVQFAQALGEFMFVFPARVQRARSDRTE